MATKLYMNYGIAPGVDVSGIIPDAAWEANAAAMTYCSMTPTKLGGTMTSIADTRTGTSGDDVAMLVLVSPPMDGAYSLDTTNFDPITCIKGAQSSNSSNSSLRVDCYIVNQAGDTVVTVDGGTDGVELALTTPTARGHSMPWDPTLTTTDGDRIVMVVGYRKASTGSYTQTLVAGSDSATDLTNDDADTGTDNPWVEFISNITFKAEASSGTPNQLMMMGCGI